MIFDFVGNMRHDLHRFAAVCARALFFQYCGIQFAARERRIFGEIYPDKTLVVTEIEIGFRAVRRDEYLAVLHGIERAGIDIHVRIEFFHRHGVPRRLQ